MQEHPRAIEARLLHDRQLQHSRGMNHRSFSSEVEELFVMAPCHSCLMGRELREEREMSLFQVGLESWTGTHQRMRCSRLKRQSPQSPCL
jgi:hypothetical protein